MHNFKFKVPVRREICQYAQLSDMFCERYDKIIQRVDRDILLFGMLRQN